MYLRNLITKMCIDIEYDLKVTLLKDLEKNMFEDGYSIVESFLKRILILFTKSKQQAHYYLLEIWSVNTLIYRKYSLHQRISIKIE